MNYQMPTQAISPYYMNQQYQPMQNPYMDRLSQIQTQSSISQQQFATLGKIVDSVDIVKATDIPMDGNMYYFPKADGSEVYGKRWLQNGTTQILAFKPILEDRGNDSLIEQEKLKIGLSDEVTEVFMSKFDNIVDRLDKLEKSIKPTTRKKEVSSDE